MKLQTWKIAGMVLALSGSVALAQTESETNPPPKMKGPKPNPEMKGPKPGPEEMIRRFDVDGDGQLSEAEKAAMHQAMQKKRGQRGRSGGPQGERPSREEMLKRFDTDGDGVLSETERDAMREERDSRREANMKRFDADGDGQLSEAERETMHKTLRDERPAPPPEKGGEI